MSCRPPAPVCRLIVDPVGSGYVVSMARPGGNATGFISIEMSLIPKARACRDQWGRGVEGAIRPLARWSPRPHYRRCKNKKLSKATGSQGGEIHVGAIPGPRCRFITRQWRSLRSREYRARWQTDPEACALHGSGWLSAGPTGEVLRPIRCRRVQIVARSRSMVREQSL